MADVVALASVVPSIWRLNLPGSVVGLSDFLTSSLPVCRTLLKVQVTVSSWATLIALIGLPSLQVALC